MFNPYQIKLQDDDKLIYAPADNEDIIQRASRFEVGDCVQCKCGEQWARGSVVGHNYEEPKGVFHPYKIQLQDDKRLVYAPADNDLVIKKLPRFEVGTRVQCHVAPQHWCKGKVVGHNYEETPGVLRPYTIRLQDGRLIYAPADDDACIQSVALAVGERVRIEGIRHSGLFGTIVGYASAGRVTVALEHGSGKELNLFAEELQPAEEESLPVSNHPTNHNLGNDISEQPLIVSMHVMADDEFIDTVILEESEKCGCIIGAFDSEDRGLPLEQRALIKDMLTQWRLVLNVAKVSSVWQPSSRSVTDMQDITDLTDDWSKDCSMHQQCACRSGDSRRKPVQARR